MIDLDESKEKWAEHDRKLEENIRLNRKLLSAIYLKGARSRLQRVLAFTVLHSIMWLVGIGALGDFIYEHIATPRFALAAAALDLYAIGMLAGLIRQITMVHRIDYGQPIAGIQKQLESVRALRIRTTQWAVLAGTVAWTPFVIVALQAFFGLDAYRIPGTAWLAANLLFGLALIPLAIWISRKFGDRMDRSPFIQRLMKDISGSNLNSAANFLATLSEIESEAPRRIIEAGKS
ncbi:MAG: hypothetical protein WB992_15985 [Bryobacteraceae bacterium]